MSQNEQFLRSTGNGTKEVVHTNDQLRAEIHGMSTYLNKEFADKKYAQETIYGEEHSVLAVRRSRWWIGMKYSQTCILKHLAVQLKIRITF